MSVDYIQAQLNSFKLATIASKKEVEQFCHESPFLRTKREVQEELARAEKYRAAILKTLTTFSNLSQEALVTAAQSMEEIIYNKGDDIIEQDDIGDSFFILEDGRVSVRRKTNMRDAYEKPRELVQLGKDAHFGEIALLTAEPRSATVTVISEYAKCLRMTKARFDELLATTNKLQAENRRIIGRDVLDKVVAFRSMSAVEKKKLLDRMVPMTYLPGSYICRQGTTGNSFFILTEGYCRVTVNEEKGEREVGKLRAGDTFGEHALTDTTNRRQANVISVEAVSCLTLSRADFRLLSNLKGKLLEAQATRGANNTSGLKASADLIQTSSLANKRRISALNTHGHRDEMRINNLFKRFSKFATECLWNSLYSRLYRELLLDPNKQLEHGTIAEAVMRENEQRYPTVQAIGAQALRILELDPPRRSIADHGFILGLMKTRNDVRDKLCKAWPAHQFSVLCKKIKMQKFIPFKRIFEIDSSGTAAYLVVRGCVRLYSKASAASSDSNAPPKAFFEQDIGPGELFGEAALGGIHTRMHLAQAMTHVDVIVIDDHDFMTAQDKDSNHMGTEERQKFLMAVPMFRHWDSYKLLRLAHVLIQEEVNKGVILAHQGRPNKDLYFVVNGRIDVVTSLNKKYVITPLLKHDYVGESSVINKFIKASANKLCEEHYCVAVTKVEVLILPETAFTLFDLHSVDVIRSTFVAKTEWRRARVKEMKYERAKMRKHMRSMDRECEALNEFPVDTEFLSHEQIRMVELAHGKTVSGAQTVPHWNDPPVMSRGNSRAASPVAQRGAAVNAANATYIANNAMALNTTTAMATAGATGGVAQLPFTPRITPRTTPRTAINNSSSLLQKIGTLSPNRGNRSADRSTSPVLKQTMQHPPGLIVRSRPSSAMRPSASTPVIYNTNKSQNQPDSPSRTMNGTAITPGKVRPKSANAHSARFPSVPQNSSSNAPTTAAGHTNTGPIEIANGKLSDIEDIPTIFVQDMDRFMALISCRTDRERLKFTTSVASALRPKSARVREIAVRAQTENVRLAKRAAVLSVLDGRKSTKGKMVMHGRRTSAAITANAMMARSAMEDRVRPHTAGELNGRKVINRDDLLDALSHIGSTSEAEQEDHGVSLSVELSPSQVGGPHVSTHHIVAESRVLAMQSGGYESQNVGGHSPALRVNTTHTPGHHTESPSPLPGIGITTPNLKPITPAGMRARPESANVRALPTVQDTSAPSSPLMRMSAFSDDELDGDQFNSQVLPAPTNTAASATNTAGIALPSAHTTNTNTEVSIEEGESHKPFATRTERLNSVLNSSFTLTDSSNENSRENSKKLRKGSMSLRGSLIIPMSTSYADTLSRSTITPKSTMAIKLEAAVDKYIHKK